MLDRNFDIATSVAELAQLEVMLSHDIVWNLFELNVVGPPVLFRGVCTTICGKRPITAPAPVPRRTAAEPGHGSCDDDDPVAIGSDADVDDRPVVDTGGVRR